VNETRPFVAVLVRVPLVSDAVTDALASIADVRTFAPDGDTDGLLRSIRPDAIVVDDAEQAVVATTFARETETPLIHISLRDERLRVLGRDGWNENADGGPSSEGIRNALAGALYRRERP
jgi:hypothetical protein